MVSSYVHFTEYYLCFKFWEFFEQWRSIIFPNVGILKMKFQTKPKIHKAKNEGIDPLYRHKKKSLLFVTFVNSFNIFKKC
jgi:hypothetical protein